MTRAVGFRRGDVERLVRAAVVEDYGDMLNREEMERVNRILPRLERTNHHDRRRPDLQRAAEG